MTTPKVVSKTYLHSTYVRNVGNGEDAIVVSEMREYDNGEVKPSLVMYRSPRVKFWVTKEPYRDHPEKKEFEHMDRLDEYHVLYRDKDKEIFRALNGYYPRFLSQKMRRDLYRSPYVYGANIDLSALVAMKYKRDLDSIGKLPQAPTTGFFDIEQSLNKDTLRQIPLLSFVAGNKVFLAMRKGFMYEDRDGKKVSVSVDDVREATARIIDPLTREIFDEVKDLGHAIGNLPFTYEFYVGDTEVDLIKWIFQKMHESKVSFIGIWNLKFDIGEITRILEENNIPMADIFTDPSILEKGIGYAKYKVDTNKKGHWTQRWHWVESPAYFQFIDSLALYSYIRTVNGKEPSYGLDDILKKFNLGGKLKVPEVEYLSELQTADWHREMLSKHFVYYALYSMWDVMGLQLLSWLNEDIPGMLTLSGTTPVKNFPNQSIRVTNTFFEEYLPEKWVLGTGTDVKSIRDEELLTEGGAVLEPQNLIAPGMKIFKEWPSHPTQIYAHNCDFDFKAQYPTNDYIMNISKQTKVTTMFAIKGEHVSPKYTPAEAIEVYCSYLITPRENGVELGSEFFNLPSYREMAALFEGRYP